MSRYHNDATRASDAVQISLSESKLRRFEPRMFGLRSLFFFFKWGYRRLDAVQTRGMLSEHLYMGDSRAAVVVQVSPLIVAAYSDELDGVAMLRFPESYVEEYGLRAGSRLLTVNTYGSHSSTDLVRGPAFLGRWSNYYPLIAEFLSDDLEAIEDRKRGIGEKEWARALAMGRAALARRQPVRDGSPLRSWKSGK